MKTAQFVAALILVCGMATTLVHAADKVVISYSSRS